MNVLWSSFYQDLKKNSYEPLEPFLDLLLSTVFSSALLFLPFSWAEESAESSYTLGKLSRKCNTLRGKAKNKTGKSFVSFYRIIVVFVGLVFSFYSVHNFWAWNNSNVLFLGFSGHKGFLAKSLNWPIDSKQRMIQLENWKSAKNAICTYCCKLYERCFGLQKFVSLALLTIKASFCQKVIFILPERSILEKWMKIWSNLEYVIFYHLKLHSTKPDDFFQ